MRQDLTPLAELVVAGNQGLQEENGWDSDSEDDLQIVLNDDRAVYPNMGSASIHRPMEANCTDVWTTSDASSLSDTYQHWQSWWCRSC